MRTSFQSTPPSREATPLGGVKALGRCISIHASLAGGDGCSGDRVQGRGHFNPRLPRGRRHAHGHCRPFVGGISIHASLAGGDDLRPLARGGGIHFNPRLPRGRRPRDSGDSRAWSYFNPRLPRGRRHRCVRKLSISAVFQSTPPSREATSAMCSSLRWMRFQSTPPSREATAGRVTRAPRGGISIHASLAGGDARSDRRNQKKGIFQSTPPSREATRRYLGRYDLLSYFNPRLPRGRRREHFSKAIQRRLFQSTPPSREATARYSLILPLEHNIWEFLRICREGCCFSLTFVAEKRRISTCFGANRPGKWAQLPLRTTGNFAYDLLLGR